MLRAWHRVAAVAGRADMNTRRPLRAIFQCAVELFPGKLIRLGRKPAIRSHSDEADPGMVLALSPGIRGQERLRTPWRASVTSFRVSIRHLAALALIVVAFVGTAARADAVPAFARKYQTSCQTCHAMFPKLNAFGEAFRLRGYRMPGETEDMVKEPAGQPRRARRTSGCGRKRSGPARFRARCRSPSTSSWRMCNTSAVNDDGSVTSVRRRLPVSAGGEHLRRRHARRPRVVPR